MYFNPVKIRDIIGLKESTNIKLKARYLDMQGQMLRWLFPGTRMRSHRPEGAYIIQSVNSACGYCHVNKYLFLALWPAQNESFFKIK